MSTVNVLKVQNTKQIHMADVSETVEQHSLAKSIFLHFMPGIISFTAIFLAYPLMRLIGLPGFFANLFVGIPLIILIHYGWLLYEAKRTTGTFSLRTIVLNRQRIPFWQYLVFPLVLAIFMFIMMALFSPLDTFLKARIFAWIPVWLYQSPDFTSLSPALQIISGSLWLVAGVIIGPIVQEMYFRGYLLPRISRLGTWAPILNTYLFSIMHFVTPWQWLSAGTSFLPSTFLVQRKRNIVLGILVHCLVNIPAGLVILGIIAYPK